MCSSDYQVCGDKEHGHWRVVSIRTHMMCLLMCDNKLVQRNITQLILYLSQKKNKLPLILSWKKFTNKNATQFFFMHSCNIVGFILCVQLHYYCYNIFIFEWCYSLGNFVKDFFFQNSGQHCLSNTYNGTYTQ